MNSKKWTKRVNPCEGGVPCVGRLNTVARSTDERYYLRLLLHHRKGATSFDDLRSFDGISYDSYKEIALAMGLLSDDNEIIYAMEETSLFGNSFKLRQLFSIILKHGEITNPSHIYELFKDELMEDILYNNRKQSQSIVIEKIENECLIQIDNLLHDMGSSMSEFPTLPQPDYSLQITLETRAFRREFYDLREQSVKLDELTYLLKNNIDQLTIFQEITQAIDNRANKQYVLNAAAGCGKTFLFNCISTHVRSKGEIALCCASTGIAAWNMEGGRTAHSMFKIPIDADANTTSNLKVQSSEAAVIRQASVIIWDEIFNVHQHTIMVVERLLRDLMENSLPFGGKIVIFGGDPRQTPPVVKQGKRGEAVAASFKSCPLYHNIKEFKLTQNMRNIDNDKEFCDWLLRIGDGKVASDSDDFIEIPTQFMLKSKMDLIDATFPNLEKTDENELMHSGIFCPMNDDVWDINEICLKKLPGVAQSYLSSDRVEDENRVQAPIELLNSRKPSGFPDHNLILKVGAPIMLLRNLQCGLVNGTRLIVKRLHNKVLECKVMVGSRKGEIIFIPRIPMYDKSNEFPWTMVRLQFPVRVCFAMTIHKGQGQSMERVGIYIKNNIFAHGQLYVALSRAVRAAGLKMFIEGGKIIVKNIVYKEIL